VADRSDVSQFIPLAGADDAATSVSQAVPLVGADDAATTVSQFVPLVAADDAGTYVSQFVVLVGFGPEVPPEPTVRTFRFDAGERSHYWLALQPSDSGDELRSKVLKAGRWTGKVTNASFVMYKWDVGEPINATEVERGENAATRRQGLPDVAHVTQSARKQVNVPNACLHAMRVQGTWEGDAIRDRLDEGVYEVAQQGVRR
jgi:hypothetical protein